MKVILKKCQASSFYIQNVQTSSLEFSLLNRTPYGFKELHAPVKCREYFGDAVVAAHLDCDVPLIYGFYLTDKRAAIDETILSIYPGYRTNFEKFISKLVILNKIEKKMKIKPTVFYRVEGEDDVLVSVGDKKWMSSPLLISIYTLIIRSFFYSTNKRTFKNHIKDLDYNYDGNDKNSFNVITGYINLEHLLVNIDKVLDNNPLTGYNDTLLCSKVMGSAPMLKETIYSLCSKHPLFTGDIDWSFYCNHSKHGILSFADNYRFSKYYKKFSNVLGGKWVYNYYKLTEKIKT